MMRKKLFLVVTIVLICISLTVISAIRIVSLNEKYPNPTVVNHSVNEEIDGGAISICINKAELLNGNEFIEQVPDYSIEINNSDGTLVSDEQIKVLLVNCCITNNSEDAQTFSLTQMYAETLSWSNGIDGDIFPLINKDYKDPTQVDIEPQQSISFVLPYNMYDFQFQKSEWNEIETKSFDITLSVYPTKHIVVLN